MVLMISEIWLTETPRNGGPICPDHAHRAGIFEITARQQFSMPIFQMRQLVRQLQHRRRR